jgi:hypothetical protein
MALDLNVYVCLGLQKHLLPAAIPDFIATLVKFFAFIKANLQQMPT